MAASSNASGERLGAFAIWALFATIPYHLEYIEKKNIMQLQLRVYGQSDLDGTHRAIVETDQTLNPPHAQAANSTAYIRLQRLGRSCACILEGVKNSHENILKIDRFKLLTLNLRDGDSVEVDFIDPQPAEQVRVTLPSEFLHRDVIRLVGKPLTKMEKTAVFTLAGEPRIIQIADTKPAGIVLLSSTTEIVTSNATDSGGDDIPVTYADIGGLSREIKAIREVVEYPLRFPELFEYLGTGSPKGVILYGPPGTGKTLIVRALIREVGAHFYSLNGPEILSMWYGESERRLRDVFEEARKHAPSVILIDELDALAPKRDEVHGDMERRIVATLLTLMDGITKQRGVVVVGTTNRPDAIDSALRRQGRFGHEIYIGVPDSGGRKQILEIHTRQMPLSNDVRLDVIAERCVGFVGADVASLCREAAYNSLRRSFSEEQFQKGEIANWQGLSVSMADFELAHPSVPPSALKEFVIEVPKVAWSDVGGLDEVKRLLVENIVYPFTKRAAFRKAGLRAARGILLYGPPGTGKTVLAKAVASQCAVNFISVKGPEVLSKWQRESAERIRFLFAKAREASPCVIFFDEIDAVAAARRGHEYSSDFDSAVNQILCEMDGIETAEGVFVIGATNRPELLDPALLRSGRFDYQVEVPLPDSAGRYAIFTVHLANKPVESEIDLCELVKRTQCFSGADIAESCRLAAMNAVRDANFEESGLVVTMSHILVGIDRVRKTKERSA
ncbi:MAG TPA: AAA family ATPase [Candidatus Saccharimonadales bacterium]|nr:AAA family ATPase [Candidatus Saccharimonadales bacterium]